MDRIGFDVGTYNLVSCSRNSEGDLVYNKEVNAFVEVSLEKPFVFNMMKKSGVPLIERTDANMAYALGEAAINMAYTLNCDLKRPMKDGCVNPKEKDAFQIMNIMIHSLIPELKHDKTILYYTVPANAINEQTDADYHAKILDAIFKAYESPEGYKLDARPINEGMTLIYSDLEEKMFTGVGVSCGAGMVNVAFGLFGVEVFSFSIVNSGDWIDQQAAKATGESVVFINKEKTKIDLEKEPETLVERAIKAQYEIMIQKTVQGIKEGFIKHEDKKARLEQPVDIILAGGTASPKGFDVLFKKIFQEANIPINLGNVIRPKEPVLSVAKGCLVAAENS